MERLTLEEAKKYVPYKRKRLAPPPKYFTITKDTDGWERVDYFTDILKSKKH